ncbi:hypothetical protein JCM24511_00363 [Saitozyma sp. JCM 24511]|nr:hypothetical protein JCM24511_00363 [Saitozyma sp. JCM 24511]
MPPKGVGPAWQKAGAASTTTARFSGQKGEEEDFAGPSRPRMYYDRPGERDLPKLNSRAPLYILIGAIGLSIGGAFILYATNAERLASSVLRQVQFQLRNSKEVMQVLGENVKMAPEWWTFGQPWTSGTINMMQGRVDLKFRIQGSRGAGTVYFTSIRPQQEGAWRIVRYKLIADSGEVLHLNEAVPA